MRIADGKTLVSSGYGGNLRILDREGVQAVAISGPTDVNPHFLCRAWGSFEAVGISSRYQLAGPWPRTWR